MRTADPREARSEGDEARAQAGGSGTEKSSISACATSSSYKTALSPIESNIDAL